MSKHWHRDITASIPTRMVSYINGAAAFTLSRLSSTSLSRTEMATSCYSSSSIGVVALEMAVTRREQAQVSSKWKRNEESALGSIITYTENQLIHIYADIREIYLVDWQCLLISPQRAWLTFSASAELVFIHSASCNRKINPRPCDNKFTDLRSSKR
jgi:hypothetical protein